MRVHACRISLYTIVSIERGGYEIVAWMLDSFLLDMIVLIAGYPN